MTPVSMARTTRRPRCMQTAVALAFALAGSSTVMAAESTAVDGILQFPNVRVLNAPQAAQAPAAAPQGGMRAYKDSADSELRGPTTEEMAAAAAAPAATSSARRSASRETATGSDFALPSGGVGVALDESSMQYTVVVRQDDGTLKEICVTGPEAAGKIVQNPSTAKSVASKELPHAR